MKDDEVLSKVTVTCADLAVGAGVCALFYKFRYVLMSVVIICRKTIVLSVAFSPRGVPVKLE